MSSFNVNRLPVDQDAERAVLSMLLDPDADGDVEGRLAPQEGDALFDTSQRFNPATPSAITTIPSWRADTYQRIRAVVSADDFFLPGYRRVFEACCHLFDAGEPVTPRRVSDALGKTDVESIATLMTIAGEQYYDIRAREWYPNRVRDMALKRRIFAAAQEIARMACTPDATGESCRTRAFDLLGLAPLAAAVASGVELFD